LDGTKAAWTTACHHFEGGSPGGEVRTNPTKILDAAAEVFSEQGYAARLSDIAERAGMKAGSLYYHFDSRESTWPAATGDG
jgi:AcrR family transcriptional regulator